MEENIENCVEGECYGKNNWRIWTKDEEGRI